ncbi:MAG: C40 family peptidase [bacterium]|nr:C40 family peptidase [bacterium]
MRNKINNFVTIRKESVKKMGDCKLMIDKILKMAGYLCLCGLCVLAQPKEAWANQTEAAAMETSTEILVKMDTDGVELYSESHVDAEVITTLEKDSIYQIEMTTPSGWIKVSGEAGTGYISSEESVTMVETTQEETAEEVAQKKSVAKREELVNYALQFLGGRYVYGGKDPHTGVDCSGFTGYVLRHGAGVTLNQSAASQALQGQAVSVEGMRPGDLIFYASGSRIDHVALYIGEGKIVHASTEKTGIKISDWNYRTPVAIRNMLGD